MSKRHIIIIKMSSTTQGDSLIANQFLNQDETIIKFHNVTKRFGKFTAVSDFNLEIKKGEIIGFLGPNGAGKTTTMKMLANLLKPTSGEIYIREGRHGELQKLTDRTEDQLLNNMGFLVEHPAFYENVTPRQALTYFAKLEGYHKDKIKARVEEVVRMVGMTEWIDSKFKTFSKGMAQKIGVVQAFIHDPDVIILDEPHSGLDPIARADLRKLLSDLKNIHHKTIFISSHILFEISEIADRVAIISNGKLIACDTLDNLEAQVQLSQIRFEVLPGSLNDDEIRNTLTQLSEDLKPLIGLEGKEIQHGHIIRYNPEKKVFELQFDGDPEKQHKILMKVLDLGLKIIDFSVPRSNLLEDLYMNLVKKAQDKSIEEVKSNIRIEKTF